MVKKIRVEHWELWYLGFCYLFLGFILGYSLGSSSSWAAKYEFKEELIPNLSVILALACALYLVVKALLYYSRKEKLVKKQKN